MFDFYDNLPYEGYLTSNNPHFKNICHLFKHITLINDNDMDAIFQKKI